MRNIKQAGSNLYDCVPQAGKCPMQCNQCYFNRGYYRETPFADSDIPEHGIVRMNCGHDSNLWRNKVLEAAAKYKHVFFNTSIPLFNFPGPVVLTANPDEEHCYTSPPKDIPDNLMAIRLRVSSTNLELIKRAIDAWKPVPIILTFMAYYDYCPEPYVTNIIFETKNYEFRTRHTNSYWCPKQSFIDSVMKMFPDVLVCGQWCKDCGNCARLYWENIR